MSTIIIGHILIGILNIVATCLCFIVAGELYVRNSDVDLVNILLGSVNLLFAIYNICYVMNMYTF